MFFKVLWMTIVPKKENVLPHISFNEKTFEEGHQWYRSGFRLDEASEDLRKDRNFVNGYNRAKRLDYFEKHLFALGEQYFNEELSIEEIPDVHRNNEIVLNGYESARINHRKK